MELTLFAGDYAYSSWSMRGWLLTDGIGLRPRLRYAQFNTPEFEALKAEILPARTVPALKVATDDGQVLTLWDSSAIAETMHELAPDAGVWPTDPAARALARSMVAEMHSAFGDLRRDCPMNMRRVYDGFIPSAAVQADLERLSALWAVARQTTRGEGPYLFGAFGAVDAFFAPVASRIATYGLAMEATDMAYVAALLDNPSVRRWRSMGYASALQQPHYEFGLPERPDPYAPALKGVAAAGPALNEACPYSGRPVAADSIMIVDGRTIGFCNTFCRDKSAADPRAWSEVAALLDA